MVENFQIEEMVEQTQRTVSYKAYNTQSGRKVLLKRYLVDDSSGIGRVKNWQEEFSTLVDRFSQLDHPSLHSVIGGGLDPQDGSPYVVFEWVEMSTLSKIIAGQQLDDTLVTAMAKSTLNGLKFLNESGVVHAGISPQLIGYTNAEDKKPWFLLWCPVRAISHKHGVGRSGLDVYSAPEVLSGSPANVSSDVYALGKTLEKALDSRSQESALTPWLVNLTQLDPEERCKTPTDALLSLEQAIANASKKTTTRVFLKTSAAPPSSSSSTTAASGTSSSKAGASAATKARPAALAKTSYQSAPPAAKKSSATRKASAAVQDRVAAQPQKKAVAGPVKVIAGLALALVAVLIAIFLFKPKAGSDSLATSRAGSKALSPAELKSTVLKPNDVALVQGVEGGMFVSIEGRVSKVGESKSGKTIMLNFQGSSQKNRDQYFSVWIPRRVHLREENLVRIQEQFEKKTIRAKGRLNYSSMTGGHYVQLSSPQDLKILGN